MRLAILVGVSAVEELTDLAVVSDPLVIDWVEFVGFVITVDVVSVACAAAVSDFVVVTAWLDDEPTKVNTKDIGHKLSHLEPYLTTSN